ncbi:DUF4013 domain-containing protein [Methanobrevibacter sp.]|uniref:DUF4013 domain-containing protein n=1 Tax=Methanobrevibacter sp. TaxID=66852 RepID=UPI00388E9BC2
MEFGEIFSNALKYPISDYQKLLILGVIFVVINLPNVLLGFNIRSRELSLVWIVISLVLNLIVLGYGLSVIKGAINLNDEIPDFDWVKNLVDGVKSFLVMFIYYLIPSIIVLIIGFSSFGSFFNAIPSTVFAPIQNITTPQSVANVPAATWQQMFSSIPAEAWSTLATGLAITAVIGIILFLIFGIFEIIAVCRLAKYDSFGEAFSFGEIFENVKEIGFLKLIGFYIVLVIISSIIGIVTGLISGIPFVGMIIGYLVGKSYNLLFRSRAIGLLYSDVE